VSKFHCGKFKLSVLSITNIEYRRINFLVVYILLINNGNIKLKNFHRRGRLVSANQYYS